MTDDLFAAPEPPARPGSTASTSNPAASPVPPPPEHGPGPAPDGPAQARRENSGFAAGTYYSPGWDPEPPAQPRTDPLAVAAVPAGVVLGPVGVGLGGAALSRIRARRTRGRGLALAGMVTGAVVTVAWVVGAVVWWQADQAGRPLAGDVDAAVTVDAARLVLASCLDELPPDGEVSQVRVVPCADEHRAQVVARTDFGADEVWPGQDGANARVARVCTADVLGPDAPDGVDLVVWAPTEASWSGGDRTGLCLVGGEEPLPADLLG